MCSSRCFPDNPLLDDKRERPLHRKEGARAEAGGEVRQLYRPVPCPDCRTVIPTCRASGRRPRLPTLNLRRHAVAARVAEAEAQPAGVVRPAALRVEPPLRPGLAWEPEATALSTRPMGKFRTSPKPEPNSRTFSSTTWLTSRNCIVTSPACRTASPTSSECRSYRLRVISLQLSEFMHTVRIIPTDNRPHIDPKFKLYQGDPVGHWEGDTLVVDTTNQNTKTWLDTSGNFKTEALHVTEKFIPQDMNTIVYEATITDPAIYTQPWTARWNMNRNRQTTMSDGHPYEQMEFGCIEGNEDLQHYTEDKGGKAPKKR